MPGPLLDYQAEVHRFLRGQAQGTVDAAPKIEGVHLLLIFDDDQLAGLVMHAIHPKRPALSPVTARVIEYNGVPLDHQGPGGLLPSNSSRASTQLPGLTFAHIAPRPVQQGLIAAAIRSAGHVAGDSGSPGGTEGR